MLFARVCMCVSLSMWCVWVCISHCSVCVYVSLSLSGVSVCVFLWCVCASDSVWCVFLSVVCVYVFFPSFCGVCVVEVFLCVWCVCVCFSVLCIVCMFDCFLMYLFFFLLRLTTHLRTTVLDAVSSPVYFLRELSATAVVALTPLDATETCVKELLARVATESACHNCSNMIHGTLMCLDKLLASRTLRYIDE